MITKIDPASAAQVHLVLARCRARGLDPVRALDELGYLSYPASQELYRRLTINEVHDRINAATPTMLGHGIVPATAMDMKRAILQTIERMSQ